MPQAELKPRSSEKDKLWGVPIVLKPAGPKAAASLQNGGDGNDIDTRPEPAQDEGQERKSIKDRIKDLLGRVLGLLLMQQTLSSRCSKCSRPIEIPVSSFLRDEVFLAKEDWLWSCELCWDELHERPHFNSQDFG